MAISAFISYSHLDAEVLAQICEQLDQIQDLSYWFDRNLRGGERYISILAEEIKKREYFIYVISRNSVASEWCYQELTYASSQKKKIIPLWLEDCELKPAIELLISSRSYIFWYRWSSEVFRLEMERSLTGKTSYKPVLTEDSEGDGEANHFHYFMTRKQKEIMENLLEDEKEHRYSICFKPENCVYLGLAYEQGYRVAQDDRRAEFYYAAGSYLGSMDCRYLAAAHNFHVGNYNGTAELEVLRETMIEAAAIGSPMFKMDLANYYYQGAMGFPEDKQTAYRLWKEAAEADDPSALYMMAFGHYSGEVEDPDIRIALMYAYRSMEYGFPRAHRITGWMYENGHYMEQNLEKAMNCFRKATVDGDDLSFSYMGRVALQLGDREQAEECFRNGVTAIESHHKKSGGMAHHFLGQFLVEDGRIYEGAEMILEGARRRYRTASQYAVGRILLLDKREERMELLKKACEYRCDHAHLTLADEYREMAMLVYGDTVDERGEICFSDHEKELWDKCLETLEAGSDLGDVNCMREIIYAYSRVSRSFLSFPENTPMHGQYPVRLGDTNRALHRYSQLFAAQTEEEADGSWYLGYALELDTEQEDHQPDFDHSEEYYRMAISLDFSQIRNVIRTALALMMYDGEDYLPAEHISHAVALYRLVHEAITADTDGSLWKTLSRDDVWELYESAGELVQLFIEDSSRSYQALPFEDSDINTRRMQEFREEMEAPFKEMLRRINESAIMD